MDTNGILHFPVTSSYQTGIPNDLRVLLPSDPRPDTLPRFLYVLPVEAGVESTYGDGIDTVRQLDLQNLYDLIVVEPAFAQIPWYGDHPTDPSIRQEKYFVEDLVGVVESLFPQTVAAGTHPVRLLVGFSKSGVGAVSLILRHPERFDAAAAWDAPLNQSTLSSLPGMWEVFGTESNYDLYSIPRTLADRSAPFVAARRLWLGGYSSQSTWRNDMIAAHLQMVSLGMLHEWADGPERAHRYDSGWLGDAVVSLTRAVPPQSVVHAD
jgi:hypothetical protein